MLRSWPITSTPAGSRSAWTRELAHAALVYQKAYNARCERSHLLSGMGRAQVPE
jgi:hypothetical protein